MEKENEKVEIKAEGCCGGGCEECRDKENCTKEGGCSSCGGCHSCGNGCDMRGKLHSYNYFEDIPGGYADDDMVEVNFKNTRKGFYLNSGKIPLEIGDIVAVEAQPGHDIGRVTLTGALVRLQMRKAGIKPDAETRRVFRKAKASDLERYEQARGRENDTMIRARKIAADLNLNMKIGDVEYQGDGNKAIFYYIADERVDFRQLIKVLAETFKVRIEMKQIGARQEAGRIGGIGPCGRPLCCTTWLTNFVSVSTGAARYQDISLNPQKLAGQCAKLKCCLNFEVDTYVEASKKLPPKDAKLETADNLYHYFKADIFKREITYSTDKNIPANLVTISAARAFEVIALNKSGEKPLSLKLEEDDEKKNSEYADILGQDSLTRFDKKKKKRKPAKSSGKKEEREGRDARENRDGREPREPRENRGPRDGGQPRDAQPKGASKGKPQEGKPSAKPQEGKPQEGGRPTNKPQEGRSAQRDGSGRRPQGRDDRRRQQPPREGKPQPKGARKPNPERQQEGGQPRNDAQPRQEGNTPVKAPNNGGGGSSASTPPVSANNNPS